MERGQGEGECSQGVIRAEWSSQSASRRESLSQAWELGRPGLAEKWGSGNGAQLVGEGADTTPMPVHTSVSGPCWVCLESALMGAAKPPPTCLISSFRIAVLARRCSTFSVACSSRRCHWGITAVSTAYNQKQDIILTPP